MCRYDRLHYKVQEWEGDSIARMLAGEHVYVDTNRFLNDIHILRCKDDVLTVLIHLGYLTYDEDSEECYIPNKEVKDLLINAYKYAFWQVVRHVPLWKICQNNKIICLIVKNRWIGRFFTCVISYFSVILHVVASSEATVLLCKKSKNIAIWQRKTYKWNACSRR